MSTPSHTLRGRTTHAPWQLSARTKQRGFQLFAALGGLWLAFMLWGCLDESSQSAGLLARFWPWMAAQPYADKFSHAVIHAILAGCLWLALLCHSRMALRTWTWREPLAVVGCCFALGVGIELLQHFFTATRQGDALDALANGAGAMLAAGVLESLLCLWHRVTGAR